MGDTSSHKDGTYRQVITPDQKTAFPGGGVSRKPVVNPRKKAKSDAIKKYNLIPSPTSLKIYTLM